MGLATLSPTPAPSPALQGLTFTPAWFVNGKQIPPTESYTIPDYDYDRARVELLVGNNIDNPAQFAAQVTRG